MKKNLSIFFLFTFLIPASAYSAQADSMSAPVPQTFIADSSILFFVLIIYSLFYVILNKAMKDVASEESPVDSSPDARNLPGGAMNLPQQTNRRQNQPASRQLTRQLAQQQTWQTNRRTNSHQAPLSLEVPRSEKSSSENILAPVYELAGHGKLDQLRKKLESGADVNERDTFFYETALHRAAKRGDEAIVRLLLESGANARLKTIPYGETPLHFAIVGRNSQVVRLLLQYGADPNAKDCFGRSPIQISRFYENLQSIFEQNVAEKKLN